ncbi:MAG: hypothetical protein ACREM1_09750 [Longimicrobiales bacterium]
MSWTTRACVEPADSGHRLRLGTVKGDAAGINFLGASSLVAGTVVAGAAAFSGGLTEALTAPIVFVASGVGAFIVNLVRLPRWARQRQQQMEHIAARIRTIIATTDLMSRPPSPSKGELES